MNWKRFTRNGLFLIMIVASLLSTGAATAETRSAAIGEMVPLSGTAIGYDMVFLLMTGPGIPSAGSRMDSSISPVVTGDPTTFTQVPVSDGKWNYTWNTARVSGGLAEGQYTVYSATQPMSAHDISRVPYSSIVFNLYRPVTTGSISIRSSPSNAQVMVNGKYSGNTPIDLTALSPREYRIDVALEGYSPARENVTVHAGEEREINFILQPVAPLTSVTTIPVTTTVLPTSSPTPPPTTSAPFPVAAFIVGLCFAFYLTMKRG